MKICVVYNTCGISGRENIGYYQQAVGSVLQQDYDNFEVVVSACCNRESRLALLLSAFPSIRINNIKSRVPINVSFNHTCKKVAQDDPDCHFLYLDSGCRFLKTDSLARMVERFRTGPTGMLSAGVTTDIGIAVDDALCYRNNLYQGRKIVLEDVVSVGCSLNLHAQLFHRELFDYYGGLMPDIFASYCTESTFTFLCAALRRQWVYLKDVVLDHHANMDGQSSGFHPAIYGRQTGRQNYDHPFAIDGFLDRFTNEYAREIGLGYEECQRIVLHREDKFDDQELAVDDRLAPYIRDNLFLKTEEFNYENIDSEMIHV